MSKFFIGDLVKVDGQNRVFKVCGVTDGRSESVPDGWLIDENGFAVNPNFCSKYKGATSCLVHLKMSQVDKSN